MITQPDLFSNIKNTKRKKCPKCRKTFIRSFKTFSGKWFKNCRPPRNEQNKIIWPSWVYHNEPTRLCQKHHIEMLSYCSKRRTQKTQASPLWANRKQIKKIYEECYLKTKTTGKKYHVDHIIPLNGKLVSGLHVENNLQIIPASENIKKSNKYKISNETHSAAVTNLNSSGGGSIEKRTSRVRSVAPYQSVV